VQKRHVTGGVRWSPAIIGVDTIISKSQSPLLTKGLATAELAVDLVHLSWMRSYGAPPPPIEER